MAKHSNRRGRRGKKKKDEERRAEDRELEAQYAPEQREKRQLELFIDTVGAAVEKEEEKVEEAVEAPSREVKEEKQQPSEESSKPDRKPRYKRDAKEQAPEAAAGQVSSLTRAPAPQVNFGLISEALQEYLKGVRTVLDSDQLQEDEEERQVFLQNVYNEIDGQELKLLGDPEASVTVEKLLLLSTPAQLLRILQVLQERLVDAATHRFASHGCQTLLRLAALCVDKELSQQGDVESAMDTDEERSAQEEPSELGECLLACLQRLKPLSVPMMYDMFSSHVLRTTLYVLAGHSTDNDEEAAPGKRNTARTNNQRNTQVSKEWKSGQMRVPRAFRILLNEFAEHIVGELNILKLRDLSFDAAANPVIQVLLSLEESGDLQLAGDSVLTRFLLGLEQDDPNNAHRRECARYLSALMRDKVGSHLFERIIACATTDTFARIFDLAFRGRLVELCKDPAANFVVQRLIPACRTPVQLELVLSEVVPLFRDLYKTRPGVLRSAVEACTLLNCGHKAVVKGLREAIGIESRDDDVHFADAFLRLQTLEEFKSHAIMRFHVQGSLILQALLKFPEERTRVVVNSLLAQNRPTLLKLAGNPVSSRVIEAFFTSPTVSDNTKHKLADTLTGSFHQLALDRYGGHILDRYWALADVARKEQIAEELLAHEQTLYASMHGKFILRNCGIEQFKRRREQWRTRQQGLTRKRDLMAELFTDTAGAAKTDKRSKKRPVPSEPTPQADERTPSTPALDTTTANKKQKKSKKAKIDEAGLAEVLGAINASAKSSQSSKKKKSDKR